MKTHYDNLQVLEKASQEVIKGAYRFLSQKWHPDKNPNNRVEAERVTRILNEAYAVLSDPERRKEHDDWILSQRKQVGRGGDGQEPVSSVHLRKNKTASHESPGFLKRSWLMIFFTLAFFMVFVLFPFQLFFGEFRGGYIVGLVFWCFVGRYSYSRLFGHRKDQ